jgi:hypothetical protein
MSKETPAPRAVSAGRVLGGIESGVATVCGRRSFLIALVTQAGRIPTVNACRRKGDGYACGPLGGVCLLQR